MSKKRLVLFGTGGFAECAHFLFTRDSPYEVAAFTVHGAHQDRDELLGAPVVPFEGLVDTHSPDDFDMFVAVGYRKMNTLRAGICGEAKASGYSLATYVSSRCTNWAERIGENCFVFEDNTLQPFVEIGDDVVLWSGNHIGHHSKIGDHCFITSHVVISGYVEVGAYSFIGVNSTLRDAIKIGESCLIGAGALIMKDAAPKQVFIPRRTKPDARSSDELDF